MIQNLETLIRCFKAPSTRKMHWQSLRINHIRIADFQKRQAKYPVSAVTLMI